MILRGAGPRARAVVATSFARSSATSRRPPREGVIIPLHVSVGWAVSTRRTAPRRRAGPRGRARDEKGEGRGAGEGGGQAAGGTA